MNLKPIRQLYTTPLLSTVYRRRDDFVKSDVPGLRATKTIWLRGEIPGLLDDHPRLADKQWLNAKNMIQRVRRAVADNIAENTAATVAAGKAPVLLGSTGRIWIESLAAESFTDWMVDKSPQSEKTVRFILTLETNPGVRHYAGGEWMHLEVGGLWWINTRAVHSILNTGIYAAISMIAEFEVSEG
jgi:hypothetical protein